ncbi:MAG: DNA-directed RNA polymerase subunit alpha [Bacteroidales bacterium]|nr:DNA-directed RNA polymerase subunit alpha [Bacteroidales bacterium]MBS3773843.1 DNA-directed RNA polymerase subunit alpha [Bacteroidales bacterium]
MALLEFQKPDKVVMLESDETQGSFEFRPLEPGYGITVGNALRRVLLSSLEGYAITKIKIEGVEHEFSTITGVIEDVSEIILNLKQVRFKQTTSDVSNEKINVTLEGKNEFRAGELNNFLTNFKVLNPDLLICTMEPDVKLQMEVHVNQGRGYVQAEENKSEDDPMGTIAIDSIFTPIKNVKYSIENYRVEQKTDYEKLLFDITTDGSIHPKDALKEAAKILIYHLMLFSDEKITLETEGEYETEEFDEEALHMRQLLKTKLTDLDLSVRALNCLKAAEVETLGDLVQYNKNDLLKFRNFGKKSLAELEELLDKMNLNFGMDVSRYKLDKE